MPLASQSRPGIGGKHLQQFKPGEKWASRFRFFSILLDQEGPHGEIFIDLGDLRIPPIPQTPTRDDVAKAMELIAVEVLGDFPFRDRDAKGKTTERAGLANAFGLLLTPHMRPLFAGSAPAFGIIKPDKGAGGTLLGKISALILDGEEVAPSPYETSEAEMQKLLVSIAQSGQSHVFFDNVKTFKSEVLLRSLTAEMIGGRILGLSKMTTRKNHLIWIFTGNNPLINDEMWRRICCIRLVKTNERKYRHAELAEWVKENRGRLIAAILILVLAWVQAGSPSSASDSVTTSPTGRSFPGWARAVGGVLEHAGIEGFLEDRRAASTDPDEAATILFAQNWWKKFAGTDVTEGQLFEMASSDAPTLTPGFDDEEKRAAFGPRLAGLDGRWFKFNGEDGQIIDRTANGKWRLVDV